MKFFDKVGYKIDGHDCMNNRGFYPFWEIIVKKLGL